MFQSLLAPSELANSVLRRNMRKIRLFSFAPLLQSIKWDLTRGATVMGGFQTAIFLLLLWCTPSLLLLICLVLRPPTEFD
jgi:hypothetical protein